MPNMSGANFLSMRAKLEGVYPTNFGVAQAGNGTIFNVTGESLSYDITNTKSKTIRSDRGVSDVAQVSSDAGGGIKCEHIFKDMDWALQSVMGADYAVYGTNGVSAALTGITLASGTITAAVAPTGNDQFDHAANGLKKGQFFGLKPPSGAPANVTEYLNSAIFRVSPTVAPSGTVITLDPATPILTAIVGTNGAGMKISTSRVYNGSAMKTWTIEAAHTDVNQFRQYFGMALDSMELTFSSGDIVEVSFEFKGQTMKLAQVTNQGVPVAAQTFTPANATKGVFDIYEGGSKISAITYIKSGKLKIANNVREQSAVGVFGAAGLALGTFEVTGSLEMYFADATHYNKVLAGQASALAIPIQDVDGNGYTYSIPKIKYTSAKLNATGMDTDNMLSVEYQGVVDTTSTNDTVGKTMAVYRH